MLRIAIAGASGRMGKMLIEAVGNAPGHDARRRPGHRHQPGHRQRSDSPSWASRAACESPPTCSRALQDADVLIDFTRPAATLAHLAVCRRNGTRMVIGTTGFTESERAMIQDAARDTAIMMSPNMSVGVNVAMKLIDMATRALAAGCDIEIVESHHRDKVDAPSGTALKMGEVVAQAQGKRLADIEVHGRHGHTGPRKPGTVGFYRHPRRRHRRRAHGDVHRHRRAHRDHPPLHQPRQLCRRAACAPPASSPPARAASTTWTTCSACAEA